MNNIGVNFCKNTGPSGNVKILNCEISYCGNSATEQTDALVRFNYSANNDLYGWSEIGNCYLHNPHFSGGGDATDTIAAPGQYLKIYNNIIEFGWCKSNSADGISVRGGYKRIYNNIFCC